MKVLLLLVPLVCGNPIEEKFEVGSPEDAAVLQQMVQDLFSERNGREIDVDDEDAEGTDVSTNLASSEPNEEKQAASLVQETDPIEIARFNNYMDAIYRRMNAALRAKLMDPMILNLDTKKKGKREGREDDHEVSKRSADLDEDAEESEVDRIGEAEEETEDVEEGEGRKLAKRGNKGKKKGGKKNKSKLSEEERKKKKEERMKNKKNKEKKKHGNKKGKKNNKGKKEGAENKKGHKGKKEGHKDKKHEKHDETKEETLARSRRNKHSHNDKNKGKKSHRKSNEEDDGKSMGSLAGIATLRRSNDVVVMNSENYKVVKSDFSIGPLQLEVSKTFGKGKSRSVKTAKAVTEELDGKMVLKVKPDGSAHVKSVFFHKPEKVEVRGSLGSQKRRSDTYLKNSVGKVRPMAAQRILKMARYVLKSPSTVERS